MLTKKGGPEVLQIVELSIEQPSPGQRRLRVRAAGVGSTDLAMLAVNIHTLRRYHSYRGYEAAGVFDAIGTGVTGFELGQRVAALTMRGSCAELPYVGPNTSFRSPTASLIAMRRRDIELRDCVAGSVNRLQPPPPACSPQKGPLHRSSPTKRRCAFTASESAAPTSMPSMEGNRFSATREYSVTSLASRWLRWVVLPKTSNRATAARSNLTSIALAASLAAVANPTAA
jgi:Alcohol dehydrogenase GroES-like domain